MFRTPTTSSSPSASTNSARASTPPSDAARLSARQLERAFGSHRALTGVTLDVAPGEVILLAGPNGAGKTTLLRCLAGLLRPTRGEVLLDGRPVTGGDAASRRAIGFVAHQTWLHDDLTLLENLAFAARLHALPSPHDAAMAALERAGLAARAGDRPPALSRGMQQRAAVARALLHAPVVRLLDEPFTGLDSDASARLRDQLAAGAREGCITVIVTHQPDDAWAVATRVVGLRKGRVALDQPVSGDAAGFRASLDAAIHG